MLNPDTVEHFAIRAAKGNTGGEWARHYTEEQKDYWRTFVRDIAASIEANGDLPEHDREEDI